jgi:flagellar hook-length control protein FliK
MLALMASFSHLHKAAAGAGKDAKDAKDTLQSAAAKADTAPTALQATLKRLAAQDDSSAVHARAGAGLVEDAQQQAAPGLAVGDAQKDTAAGSIDLRAAFGAATRGKTEPADFGAKAREIAAKLETIAPTAAPLPVQAQLQAAAVEAARPSAAAAEHLSARVGSTEWDNQVGQKIVWMVGSEEQTASLTLNPPDLGPMQVVLSVTGDQASVAFSASHEDVRHALESALPRLREMMGESGIELGSATVGTGMPDQRQAQGEQGGSGSRGSGNGSFAANAGGGGDAAPPVATRVTSVGDGMVDTFA